MPILLSNRRRVVPEIMDRPDVAEADHLDALEGLRRINEKSMAAEQIARPIIEMARRQQLTRISIVDAACGGGDVPIGVAQRAKSAGVDVELTLVDRSDTALAAAKTAADRAAISCQCVCADLMDRWPQIHADVVTSSLFLHHIPDGAGVAKFLGEAKTVARRAIVISDLRRARMGWLVAWFGGRMLSGSKIVHHDGPVSVRAAWTLGEMKKFAQDARLAGARITRSFPWRMLLVWEPMGEQNA